MSRLLRNILIVLGLTIALTSAGLGLILGRDEPVSAAVRNSATVMIAARQIPAGHRIEKADLGWKDVGSGALPAGAFAKPAHSELNAIGSVALQNLAPGEMIGQQHLALPTAGDTLAGNLNPGWRAVTFEADASQSLAGLIVPNDRVDLFLAVAPRSSTPIPNPLSFGNANGVGLGDNSTTIGNIRVIAVDGAMRPKGDAGAAVAAGQRSGGTVTLEVRPDQVGVVLGAASSGRLGIALRSRFDSAAVSSPNDDPKRTVSTLQKGPAGSARTTRSAKDAKPDLTRSVTPGVIIIRGGEKSRAK